MAEATVFILIAALVEIVFLLMFDIKSIDVRLLLAPVVILLIPGFYAAITSGPFVPSSRKRHRAMIHLADLKQSDVVYDLGCGDGRLIFGASKHCKKAIGYELSIPLYLFAKLRQLFSRRNVFIRYGNIWKQNYQDADVIFCYLLPKAMKQFYQEIWPKLKPGTRVISNAFQIHEVKPVAQEEKVFLYQV